MESLICDKVCSHPLEVNLEVSTLMDGMFFVDVLFLPPLTRGGNVSFFYPRRGAAALWPEARPAQVSEVFP